MPVGAFLSLAGGGKTEYNGGMKSLLQSNRYLANRRTREAWLRQSALESSIFEGARGLSTHSRGIRRNRRSIAAAKKAAKGS